MSSTWLGSLWLGSFWRRLSAFWVSRLWSNSLRVSGLWLGSLWLSTAPDSDAAGLSLSTTDADTAHSEHWNTWVLTPSTGMGNYSKPCRIDSGTSSGQGMIRATNITTEPSQSWRPISTVRTKICSSTASNVDNASGRSIRADDHLSSNGSKGSSGRINLGSCMLSQWQPWPAWKLNDFLRVLLSSVTRSRRGGDRSAPAAEVVLAAAMAALAALGWHSCGGTYLWKPCVTTILDAFGYWWW